MAACHTLSLLNKYNKKIYKKKIVLNYVRFTQELQLTPYMG